MRRPKKGDIRPNQDYLKDWDDYQNARPGQRPILLPIAVDINARGEITRDRMKAEDVEDMFAHCKAELPDFLSNEAINSHDPVAIFEDYIDYFKDMDAAQGPVATPLDIRTRKPVWALFHLPRKNWKFSKDQQYSTVNDRDDMLRNFEKICTFDRNNYLLLSNRFLSHPARLKFNLHVSISQKSAAGKVQKTPIIIDPDWDNDRGNEDEPNGGS